MAPDTVRAEARLRREREFHDDRYTEENRARQQQFYAGLDDSRNAFSRATQVFSPGDRVLELGCGPTSTGWDLADRGIDVLGIDISPVAVAAGRDLATERGIPRIAFRQMNAESLDLDDTSLDGVIGTGILHHLDLDTAFAEIRRVLRPSGRAVFFEPLGHNPLINVYRRFTPDARTPDEHPLVRHDIERATQLFGRVETSTHHILSPAAGPVSARRWGGRAQSALGRIDRMIVRVPGMRWQAWIAVIVLEEPRC